MLRAVVHRPWVCYIHETTGCCEPSSIDRGFVTYTKRQDVASRRPSTGGLLHTRNDRMLRAVVHRPAFVTYTKRQDRCEPSSIDRGFVTYTKRQDVASRRPSTGGLLHTRNDRMLRAVVHRPGVCYIHETTGCCEPSSIDRGFVTYTKRQDVASRRPSTVGLLHTRKRQDVASRRPSTVGLLHTRNDRMLRAVVHRPWVCYIHETTGCCEPSSIDRGFVTYTKRQDVASRRPSTGGLLHTRNDRMLRAVVHRPWVCYIHETTGCCEPSSNDRGFVTYTKRQDVASRRPRPWVCYIHETTGCCEPSSIDRGLLHTRNDRMLRAVVHRPWVCYIHETTGCCEPSSIDRGFVTYTKRQDVASRRPSTVGLLHTRNDRMLRAVVHRPWVCYIHETTGCCEPSSIDRGFVTYTKRQDVASHRPSTGGLLHTRNDRMLRAVVHRPWVCYIHETTGCCEPSSIDRGFVTYTKRQDVASRRPSTVGLLHYTKRPGPSAPKTSSVA